MKPKQVTRSREDKIGTFQRTTNCMEKYVDLITYHFNTRLPHGYRLVLAFFPSEIARLWKQMSARCPEIRSTDEEWNQLLNNSARFWPLLNKDETQKPFKRPQRSEILGNCSCKAFHYVPFVAIVNWAGLPAERLAAPNTKIRYHKKIQTVSLLITYMHMFSQYDSYASFSHWKHYVVLISFQNVVVAKIKPVYTLRVYRTSSDDV